MSVRHNHQLLSQFQKEGQHEGGIDSLRQEFPSQYLQSGDDEDSVDDEESVLHRKGGSIEDDGSYTSDTSRHYLVGQQEYSEAEGVKHQSQGYSDIILDFVQYLLVHFTLV